MCDLIEGHRIILVIIGPPTRPTAIDNPRLRGNNIYVLGWYDFRSRSYFWKTVDGSSYAGSNETIARLA
jgi:hypothetical protein